MRGEWGKLARNKEKQSRKERETKKKRKDRQHEADHFVSKTDKLMRKGLSSERREVNRILCEDGGFKELLNC
mgnify:FL=1